MGTTQPEQVKTRRYRSEPFDKRLRIVREVRRLVDSGVAKSTASLRAGGYHWNNVQRWMLKDARLWAEYYDTPYPFHVAGKPGPVTHADLVTWPHAVQLMRQGKMIRAEGSSLYRYAIEQGKLVEYRRGIYSYDWHEAPVTLTRQQTRRWLFEEVEL